jgi:photosystem II stability/assembly factor-like uncharacterized protein
VEPSADGGATWRERPGLITDATAVDLTVDPHDAQTVYALAAGSLQRTQDGGRHWTGIISGSHYVQTFTLDGEDSRVLFTVLK